VVCGYWGVWCIVLVSGWCVCDGVVGVIRVIKIELMLFFCLDGIGCYGLLW